MVRRAGLCRATICDNTYKKTRQQTIMRRILEDPKTERESPHRPCVPSEPGEEHVFQTHSGDQHTVVKSKAPLH